MVMSFLFTFTATERPSRHRLLEKERHTNQKKKSGNDEAKDTPPRKAARVFGGALALLLTPSPRATLLLFDEGIAVAGLVEDAFYWSVLAQFGASGAPNHISSRDSD